MKYIIGDVHGCYKSLIALIEKLPKNSEIIFVGDLIDRGPDSCSVIEYVKQNKLDCVLGNHEKMMIHDLYKAIERQNNPNNISYTDWEYNGGINCLKSYIGREHLLQEHLEWLKELPLFLIYEEEKDNKGRKLLISHTSVVNFFDKYKELILKIEKKDNNVYTEEEKVDYLYEKEVYEDAMIWSRSVPNKRDNDFFNIFGHTPIQYMKESMLSLKEMEHLSYENIILSEEIGFADVDTGCVFGEELTAIEFPSMKIFIQKNIDI